MQAVRNLKAQSIIEDTFKRVSPRAYRKYGFFLTKGFQRIQRETGMTVADWLDVLKEELSKNWP